MVPIKAIDWRMANPKLEYQNSFLFIFSFFAFASGFGAILRRALRLYKTKKLRVKN